MPQDMPRGLPVVIALFSMAGLLAFVFAAVAAITAAVPYSEASSTRNALVATAVPLGALLLLAALGLARQRRWGRALALGLLLVCAPWAAIFALGTAASGGRSAAQSTAIAILCAGVLLACAGGTLYLTLGPGRSTGR